MKHSVIPRRILLIEDDPPLREIYREIITSAGFQVLTAATVKAGLKLFTQQQFDLILLDLLMTKISGLTFLEKIKIIQPSTLSRPPVIILTNLIIPRLKHNLLALGATDYWRKLDLNPEQLIQRINKSLSEQKNLL